MGHLPMRKATFCEAGLRPPLRTSTKSRVISHDANRNLPAERQGLKVFRRYPGIHQLRQCPEAKARVEIGITQQYTTRAAKRLQLVQNRLHQPGAHSLTLQRREHRDWPNAIPAGCTIRNAHRRRGHVPDDGTGFFGNQGDGQGTCPAQGLDDELLVVTGVWRVQEGGHCHGIDCCNIREGFISDRDSGATLQALPPIPYLAAVMRVRISYAASTRSLIGKFLLARMTMPDRCAGTNAT